MMTAFWCLQVNGGHSPGVLPQMRHDSLGFLRAMVRTYGDIVALPFGPVRV